VSTLFEAAAIADGAPRPLAERLRPEQLEDVVGQDHLLGPIGPIGRMMAQGRISSMILWGPPGTGKTTIARLLAHLGGHHFEQLSAVFSGVADLRRVFDAAATRRQDGQGTVLFVDEIHRFNRSQQDGFLPFVEDGTIILIGATTENPSFELNPPLLSRAQVLVLKRLGDDSIELLLDRAEKMDGRSLPLTDDARGALRAMADGDGRYALNLAEELLMLPGEIPLDTKALASAIQHRAPIYDRSREGHYNLVSALHKSVRGSDVDAALYWLARMLAGGEDPLFIARRIVRIALEDIGLADPHGLVQALAAKDAYEFLGSPEGELAIAQAVIYLASAPKSNAAYRAFNEASASAAETGSLMPPKRALNASTRLMKQLGYGKGYQYDHEAKGGFAAENYFPDEMPRKTYYQPTDRGGEVAIGERLDAWRRLRRNSG
jgi:putative ATPase